LPKRCALNETEKSSVQLLLTACRGVKTGSYVNQGAENLKGSSLYLQFGEQRISQ